MWLLVTLGVCLLAPYTHGVCSSDDEAAVATCLKPVNDLWSSLQSDQSRLANVTFPLYRYKRAQLVEFCSSFNQLKQGCLSRDLVQKCRNLPLVNFTLSFLDYPCGDESAKFLDQFDCIASASAKAEQCEEFLLGPSSNPGQYADKCRKIPQYLSCVTPVIQDECKSEGVAIFQKSVETFGCATSTGQCTADLSGEVQQCVEPLLTRFKTIAAQDGIDTIAFPLFYLSPAAVDNLCSTYHTLLDGCYSSDMIQHCKSSATVRSLESLFAYPCQFSNDAFFKKFTCIASVIKASPNCAAFNLGSPKEETKCARIPEFYSCLRDKLVAKCTLDGLKVFEEAIDAFGCSDLLRKIAQLPNNICEHTMDIGSCGNQFVRWFHDSNKRICHKFIYGGCGGNGNNFASKEECEKICRTSGSEFVIKLPLQTAFNGEKNQSAPTTATPKLVEAKTISSAPIVTNITTLPFLQQNNNRTTDQPVLNITKSGVKLSEKPQVADVFREIPQSAAAKIIKSGDKPQVADLFRGNPELLPVQSTLVQTTIKPSESPASTTQHAVTTASANQTVPITQTTAAKGLNQTVSVANATAAPETTKVATTAAKVANVTVATTASAATTIATATTVAVITTQEPAAAQQADAVLQAQTIAQNPIEPETTTASTEPSTTTSVAQTTTIQASTVAQLASTPQSDFNAAGLFGPRQTQNPVDVQPQQPQIPVVPVAPVAPQIPIAPVPQQPQIVPQTAAPQQPQIPQQPIGQRPDDSNILRAVFGENQLGNGNGLEPNRNDVVQKVNVVNVPPPVLPVQEAFDPLKQFAPTPAPHPQPQQSGVIIDELDFFGNPVQLVQQISGGGCPPLVNCTLPDCLIMTAPGGCQLCSCLGRPQVPFNSLPVLQTLPPQPTVETVLEDCSKADTAEVTECVKPIVSTWQDIRRHIKEADRITFSLYRYKSSDLIRLCADYRWLHDSCYTPKMLNKCGRHPFVVYIESFFAFPCKNDTSQSFFDSFDCIQTISTAATVCTSLIRGTYLPGKEEAKCTNIPQYFSCMAANVRKSCGDASFNAFQGAMQAYGCPLSQVQTELPPAPVVPVVRPQQVLPPGIERPQIPVFNPGFAPNFAPIPNAQSNGPVRPQFPPQAALNPQSQFILRPQQRIQLPPQPVPVKPTDPPVKCSGDMRQRVRSCFATVQNGLAVADRQRSADISNVSFPLYTYSKVQMLELCDQYATAFITCRASEMRACQSDDLFKFVVSRLGYACGRNVVEFFTHYDCISTAVKDNPQCLQPLKGQSQADKVCKGVADFYQCANEPVSASCRQSPEALKILQESIVRFGCSLNGDVTQPEDLPFPFPGNLAEMQKVHTMMTEGKTSAPTSSNAQVVVAQAAPAPNLPINNAPFEASLFIPDGKTNKLVPLVPSSDKKAVSSRVDSMLKTAMNNKHSNAAAISDVSSVPVGTVLEIPVPPVGTDRPTLILTSGFQNSHDTLPFPTVPPNGIAKTTDELPEETCDRPNLQDLVGCMKPTITTWNAVQSKRSDTNAVEVPQVLFGLFTYSQDDLDWVCGDYRWMRNSCYSPKMLSACVGHPYVTYFESQLAFGCGTEREKEFRTHFNCIRSVTLNSTECLRLIRGKYSPGGDDQKCQNALNYYSCMADQIALNCNDSAVEIFRSAIEHFGCLATTSLTVANNSASNISETSLDVISAKVLESLPIGIAGPPAFQPPTPTPKPKIATGCHDRLKQKVSKCFTPTLNLLQNTTVANTNVTNISFKLFGYDKNQLLSLCDEYTDAFRKCPKEQVKLCGDQLPDYQLISSRLGFPCGKNLIEFFRHFDCISTVAATNQQCWDSLKTGEILNEDQKCRGIPEYFSCLKPQLFVNCPAGAIEIVQTVIKRFGCAFERRL